MMIRKFLTSLLVLCFLAVSAFGQDEPLMPTGADISFVGCTSDTTDLTTYTFSSHAVGPTGENRRTLIMATAEDAATIFHLLTVTVGGDSADVSTDNRGNAAAPMGVYSAVVDNPSGTSEDIVLTFDEAIQGVTICVWAAYRLHIGIPWHAVINSTTGGAAMTSTIIGKTYGIITGLCMAVSGSGGFTLTVEASDGYVATESTDTSTAEWQYAAYTGKFGFAQGPSTWNCDTTSDAVTSITHVIIWSNTVEPRIYQTACFANDGDLTTYTETNVPTGVPHASRKTAIGILAQDGATNFNFSSGTIGGAASTELVETSTTGLMEATIYYLDANTAGDHETVAITMSEAITGTGYCIWAIYFLASNTATGSVANASNAAASMSGDVAATGGGVCAAISGSHVTGTTATWAGQSHQNISGFDSAERGIAQAMRWYAPGATYDLDVDWSGTTADTAIASGCWR